MNGMTKDTFHWVVFQRYLKGVAHALRFISLTSHAKSVGSDDLTGNFEGETVQVGNLF